MESLTTEILALLFLAGLIGGFVDAIAGGGGLISVPILLATGMGPVHALATNKAQAMFGSFTAMYTYAKNGHVHISTMKWAIAFTFVGSAVGTLLVQVLDPRIMLQMIPFMLIGVAMYFAFGPRIGNEDRHHYLGQGPFYFIFGLGIGFYDGFFGPGTGSLWTLVFVTVLGFNMLKAVAHTKVVNFTSNITSFVFFAAAGYVVWDVVLYMVVGQLIGSRLGATTAMKHGAGVIRPILVVMSLVITAKLITDDPDNIIHMWVLALMA